MKIFAAVLCCLLCLCCEADLVITNSYWRFGTNGFNIFTATVSGSKQGKVYMWQSTTDLSPPTNWFNEFSGVFGGSDDDQKFTYVIDSGNTNKFFRVVEVGTP